MNRTRWFRMEDIRKTGKSWQEICKKKLCADRRDWRLLSINLYKNAYIATCRRGKIFDELILVQPQFNLLTSMQAYSYFVCTTGWFYLWAEWCICQQTRSYAEAIDGRDNSAQSFLFLAFVVFTSGPSGTCEWRLQLSYCMKRMAGWLEGNVGKYAGGRIIGG